MINARQHPQQRDIDGDVSAHVLGWCEVEAELPRCSGAHTSPSASEASAVKRSARTKNLFPVDKLPVPMICALPLSSMKVRRRGMFLLVSRRDDGLHRFAAGEETVSVYKQ